METEIDAQKVHFCSWTIRGFNLQKEMDFTMGITNKGKKWELRNSIWILWSFTLLLACVGFFWIGGRTGRRRWIVFGLVYLVTNFGLIYVAQAFEDINSVVHGTISAVIYISWMIAIVHAFLSRKEYLIRREAVLELKNSTRDAYRDSIRKDYLGSGGKPAIHASGPMANNSSRQNTLVNQHVPIAQKINLNIASEQELSNLPGVGVALAKRALELRSQIGGFVSVQDFHQRLGLMPHFAVQIEKMAFVDSSVLQEAQPSPEATGRVIDI